MDHIARFEATEIMHSQGYRAAHDYIRGYVICYDTATKIADEIASGV